MLFNQNRADQYDGWYATKMGNFVDAVETKTAFDLFNPRPGERVLDAGCGTGNFSIKLARMGCRVTGVDVSEAMLEKARRKTEEAKLPIDYYRQDIMSLDFPADSFDGVASMATVEFVADLQAAYREMKRVTKAGGKILIGTITRDSAWGKRYLEQGKEEQSIFHQAIFRNPEEFAVIDPANLIEVRECLFIPPDTPPGSISWEEEARLAGKVRGGFVCALWRLRNDKS